MHGNQRQTLLSYAAGIFDADGCFMITKHKRDRFSPTYLPSMKIAMVEKEAILSLVEDLGYGTILKEGARKSRPTSKDMYIWYLRSKGVIQKFLEELIPYLKIKRDRAQFLLDYCNKVKDCPSPTLGLDDEELVFREESYKNMRKLNGYKVAATTESSGPERVSHSLAS